MNEGEPAAYLIRALHDERREIVFEALETLRRKSWLHDGTLRDADLKEVDLSDTDLWGADLTGADLSHANLAGALLFNARLENVDLLGANLSEARLPFAKLLRVKHLTVEQLQTVSSLEGCVLPDGIQLPRRVEMFDSEPDWREQFESWCKAVHTDGNGFISSG